MFGIIIVEVSTKTFNYISTLKYIFQLKKVTYFYLNHDDLLLFPF